MSRQNPFLAAKINKQQAQVTGNAFPTYPHGRPSGIPPPVHAGQVPQRFGSHPHMTRPTTAQPTANTIQSLVKQFAQRGDVINARRSSRMHNNRSVTQAVSSLPYKGKLIYFLRGQVKLDANTGWKFIKPDADEGAKRKSAEKKDEKSSTVLFDPVTFCQVNLDTQADRLRPKRARKASKPKSFERDEREAHGRIDFEVLKQKVKSETEKFDLDHDFDVNKILSFALQDYMKTLVEKLYTSCQIRRNIPLEDSQLSQLIQKSSLPEKHLEEVQKRDEVEQRNQRRIEEIKMLRSEQDAIEDSRLQSMAARKNLEQVRSQISTAKNVIFEDIEARAAQTLGLGSTELNIGPPQKRRRLDPKQAGSKAGKPVVLPEMIDVLAFLQQNERYRKSDLLRKYFLNLGRPRARKLDLRHIFNR